LFDAVSLTSKFGEYNAKIEKLTDNQLKYTRKLTLNKGKYTKEDYKVFRKFYSNIVKHDKSKIALKK